MRTYLVQLAGVGAVNHELFRPVEASSVRAAALDYAADNWPEGADAVEVLVVPPGAPRHPNGMPMTVHGIRLSVR
jgi:hypothetical protein